MRLLILYDNRAGEGFRPAWGFSCLVMAPGRNVLFDTGGDPGILEHNMKRLGLEREGIGDVVISHDHWDHTGGLPAVVHPGLTVRLPPAASEELRSAVSGCAASIEAGGPETISEGVHTTGAIEGDVPEQSLVVDGERGTTLITGCAHPGLGRIMERGARFGRISCVLGGFHDFDRPALLKDLDLIGPCHCTSIKERLRKEFASRFLDVRAGAQFRI